MRTNRSFLGRLAPARGPNALRRQRGVTTAEYVVLGAVLVLGLVAGVSLFRGRVAESLDTEGAAFGEVAQGKIAPVRDRYGESSGVSGGLGTAQSALSEGAQAMPEDRVLGALPAGPKGPRSDGASGGGQRSGGPASSAPSGGDSRGAAAPPAVKSGLGADIDQAITASPRLSSGVKALKDKGWKLEYGKAGAGSYCDRDAKKIVFDGRSQGDVKSTLTTLAHELGHAQYKEDPYVDMTGLTKDEFVQRNAMRNLKDEGEAVLTNIEVRRELQAAKGTKISVAGAGAAEYEKVYDAYLEHGDRDRARTEIARKFGSAEHPSTDPSKTYTEYYGKPYSDYWDSVNAAESKKGSK